MSDDQAATLADALVRVQARLPHVGKDKTAQVRSEKGSYSYSYADLADIARVLMPLLAAEGLAWTCRPTLDGDRFALRYSLLHVSGEREDGAYPLPDPVRSTPQQIGSAITYGRRYCLTAVTGLVVGGEDDDGQAASSTTAASPPDPVKVAKRALWQHAQTVGMDASALAERFAEWAQGEQLGDADEAAVREFLDHLRGEAT